MLEGCAITNALRYSVCSNVYNEVSWQISLYTLIYINKKILPRMQYYLLIVAFVCIMSHPIFERCGIDTTNHLLVTKNYICPIVIDMSIYSLAISPTLLRLVLV
jgi:hypothetical protein